MTIDSFLSDFNWFRSYCDQQAYDGVTSPIDGVFYPGVNMDIPPTVYSDVVEKLQSSIKSKINNVTMFLRMTLEGVPVPHSAHTDATMGDYGVIVFLNRSEHCKGGTSFVRHIDTGMDSNPANLLEESIWHRDTNNLDAWEVKEMIGMAPNRAFVFDCRDMHRAETPSSFGTTPEDGRLVLVCFARCSE